MIARDVARVYTGGLSTVGIGGMITLKQFEHVCTIYKPMIRGIWGCNLSCAPRPRASRPASFGDGCCFEGWGSADKLLLSLNPAVCIALFFSLRRMFDDFAAS